MNRRLIKGLLFEEFDTMLSRIEDDLGIKPIELTDFEQDECDEILETFTNFIMKLYDKHY